MDIKQKKVTVDGIEFTFQHPGARMATRIRDNSRGPSGYLDEPLYEGFMQHVIVNPKTDWTFWDEHEHILQEVMAEAATFLVESRIRREAAPTEGQG